MEKYDLVLNIHGEKVGSAPADAEADFLPELFRLVHNFPNLRIVCEHISTKAGLEAVRQCGSNVQVHGKDARYETG